jgi:hypothetical protein
VAWNIVPSQHRPHDRHNSEISLLPVDNHAIHSLPSLIVRSRRSFLLGAAAAGAALATTAIVGVAPAGAAPVDARKPPAPPKPNLLTNPSFEADPAGRTITGWDVTR